uniref:Uncharacterized protein n=1 Tax=Populus alba TaxID=43335 RepID=A0A4U5MPI6_POPAL|nr:hypothetical protein D5086_0000300550 [Populus alba]
MISGAPAYGKGSQCELIVKKVRARLEIYKKNAESILSTCSNIMVKIDGNHQKEVVFQEIGSFLSQVQKDKAKLVKPGKCFQVLKFLYKFAQGVASKSMEKEKREERRRKGKKMAIGATTSTKFQHAFCPTLPRNDVNGVRMKPCTSL